MEVLFIDDDLDIIGEAVGQLYVDGHKVHVADSFDEGMRLIEQFRNQLAAVVVDLHLPPPEGRVFSRTSDFGHYPGLGLAIFAAEETEIPRIFILTGQYDHRPLPPRTKLIFKGCGATKMLLDALREEVSKS